MSSAASCHCRRVMFLSSPPITIHHRPPSLTHAPTPHLLAPPEKPFTTTWVMFVAMFMALPLYFITSRCCQKEPELAGAKGGKVPAVPGGITTRTFFLLMIPALFDLVGTALAKCGLLFVNVSVYQLVRCSVIVICEHLISPCTRTHSIGGSPPSNNSYTSVLCPAPHVPRERVAGPTTYAHARGSLSLVGPQDLLVVLRPDRLTRPANPTGSPPHSPALAHPL